MGEPNKDSIWDIAARGLRNVTNEELARLKGLSDDDMLRAAGSLDAFAIVEASRRLRRATGFLTWVLIVLTFILVVLGLADWWRPGRGSNTETSMANWLACIESFLTAHPLANAVLGGFIGAVASVPVAWFFSWLYYRRAANQLRETAEKLWRKL
jgi:ABC-type Fe3+ transport system permease subunit